MTSFPRNAALSTFLRQWSLMELCWTRKIASCVRQKSICSRDWHIVLHYSQLSLILALSVVWLRSIDIVIYLWKVLFDYFCKKAIQKCLLIQNIIIWTEKLVDKLLEYSLCTDKLLNFPWTCILRIGSFSKRKIH